MRKTKEVLRKLGAESSTKKEVNMKRYLIHALSLGGLLLGMSIAGGVVAGPRDRNLPPGQMFYNLQREEELPCEYLPTFLAPWTCSIAGTGRSFSEFWLPCDLNDTEIPAFSRSASAAVAGSAFVVTGNPVGRVRLASDASALQNPQMHTVRFLTLCENTSELLP